MRILLLTPPIPRRSVYGILAPLAPSLPPLGLTSLGTVLTAEGHEVEIIDAAARGIGEGKLLEEAGKFSPELVGITSTTCGYERVRDLLPKLRENLPRTRLVLGGPHLTALPRETMEECPDLDIGVIGEGEVTIEDAVEAIEAGRSLASTAGLIFRDGPEIVRTPDRPFLEDLDKLPLPDRSLLGDTSVYRPTPLRGFGRTTSMVTSRGCPLGCTYCDQSVFGSRWRGFSAGRIVEEMKKLVAEDGVEFISFEDDNFLADKDRVRRLSALIREEKLKVGWGCAVRLEDAEAGLIREMKEAGCRYLYLGIESGSRRILRLLGRNPDLGRVEKGVAGIKKAGLLAYGAFMMGVPTETEEDLARTRRLALGLPLDGLFLFQYTPYPNTRLRELAVEAGWVSPRWEDYSAHPTNPAFRGRSVPPRRVACWIAGTYVRFFLRPGNLGKLAFRIGNFKFRGKLSTGFSGNEAGCR